MEKKKIGTVGVDSGQLMICDPSYIDSQWTNPDSGSYDDFGHPIYRHKTDGSLWQYTYGKKPQGGVNKFPGSYQDVIPEYGMNPNELISSGILVYDKSIDTRPHIPKGEFSYRGICKANDGGYAQMNYNMGHEGVAVAFSSGFGDGVYDVYAEIEDYGPLGKRIKRVIIEMITDKEIEQMNELMNR